jgi:MerR family transcriptional regulator, light-induced transcriptional regulator
MDQEFQNQNASTEPLYNIGVVSRMTGISVATLRAWERRYGFPSSGRTAGGHRLYSESDMSRLRWVKGQIEQGMQTAQAIQVLRYREAPERSGRQRAQTVRPRASMASGSTLTPALAQEPPGGTSATLGNYREELENALLEYDVAAADNILGQVLLSYSLDDLIFKVIEPAFVAIGLAWEDQRMSVAMEHLTTYYLRHRLLMWMLSGPPLYPVKPVVLACAPGELHEGSLLILGALLRRRRWPVAYLGQTVPLADLASLVQDMQPEVVVLVAMTEASAAELVEWPRYFPKATAHGRPEIAFGGRVFSEQPEWRDRVAGVYLGATLEAGITTLDDMLSARMVTAESDGRQSRK